MRDAECRFCQGLRLFERWREGRATLPPQLPAEMLVGELPSALAVLSLDQYYRGYTVVLAKTHATELFHLAEEESGQFVRDMNRVAKAIAQAFGARKMNYELLGNTVPHLHWHVVPRYDWDANPTRPIWEHVHEPVHLAPAGYAEIAAAIRAALGSLD